MLHAKPHQMTSIYPDVFRTKRQQSPSFSSHNLRQQLVPQMRRAMSCTACLPPRLAYSHIYSRTPTTHTTIHTRHPRRGNEKTVGRKQGAIRSCIVTEKLPLELKTREQSQVNCTLYTHRHAHIQYRLHIPTSSLHLLHRHSNTSSAKSSSRTLSTHE